ncbi:MAG: SHOCT domain-containing protein [Alistipes sp.]|nr:SHOCT domain-containing protein [Alistipes sp.]
MEEYKFKSPYILRFLRGDWNPFTPDRLTINDQFIEHIRRNWYLISKDTNTYHFQSIVGVSVDKHLFGATLKIMPAGSTGYIYIHAFKKKDANRIKQLCQEFISKNSQRGIGDIMGSAITDALEKHSAVVTSSAPVVNSKTQELRNLKELLEEGIITQEEFVEQKQKILNS